MDHLLNLCNDHKGLVYLMATILVLTGVGLAMFLKTLLPGILRAWSKLKPGTIVNVGGVALEEQLQHHDLKVHGPYCNYPCTEHGSMKSFMDEVKEQQKRNMEVISAMRTNQETNAQIVTEVRAQQTRMWGIINQIPNELGVMKGELGEIKGMITVLHDMKTRR